MARKTRFRQQRIYKLKIAIVLILFVAVLTSGLLVVDLNKSYMMYGEPNLEIFQIQRFDQDVYRVKVLNNRFTLNLKYIMRDINNIKSFLKSR